MTSPSIISGMRVRSKHERWYCACGNCVVTADETLTVRERKYFPGIGAMLAFEEHRDDAHEPWFLASGFAPRHDA